MKNSLLTLIAILLPFVASAERVEIDGIYYSLDTGAKTAEVVNNPFEYQGDVVIPNLVTYSGIDYYVTSIASLAFFRSNNLTSVAIGNNVTLIDIGAFEYCQSLASVTLGMLLI